MIDRDSSMTRAQKQVDEALKCLAAASIAPEFVYEYLFLINEVVSIYNKFSDARGSDDEENALKYARWIVNIVEMEKKEGMLKAVSDEE
ncbi:MAG: hypothetical protein IIY69_01300 [Clostridia bacterium]|nr:hypothetical protein [Clostridia bacterium]